MKLGLTLAYQFWQQHVSSWNGSLSLSIKQRTNDFFLLIIYGPLSFSLFSVSIDVWIITVNITVLVTLSHSDARTWGYQFLVCFISAYNPPSLPAYKKKIYNKTNQKKEVERIALTGKKNRKKMTSFLGHKHREWPHIKRNRTKW